MTNDLRKKQIQKEIDNQTEQLKTHRNNIKVLKARMSILEEDDIVNLVKLQDQMDACHKLKDKVSADFYFLHAELQKLEQS